MLQSKQKLDNIREIAPYLGLGTQLAATVIILFFLGKWLDDTFDTLPLFVIIFTLFGSFAGLYNFIRSVTSLNEKKKNDTDN